MYRFLAGCVVVAGLGVGAVLLLSKGMPDIRIPGYHAVDDDDGKPANPPRKKDGSIAKPAAPDGDTPPPPRMGSDDDFQKAILVRSPSRSGDQSIVIQEARLMTVERPDVPSERDGKLLFLATPIKPGEFVPVRKLLEFEVPTLGIEVSAADYRDLDPEEQIKDVDEPQKWYRAVRLKDSLAPGTTVVVRQKVRFRKLEVGDRVAEGQILGVINPVLAIAEMYIKQQKVEGAEYEVKGAIAMKVEYERRLASMRGLNARQSGAVTKDEIGATEATLWKTKAEENTKREGVKQAQQELRASLTTLRQHTIRAPVDGIIKSFYKQAGEAVKNLEPVLQIQNPKFLRVEGEVEIQEALALRDRIQQARKYRDAALAIRLKEGATGAARAQDYDAAADRILAIEIEASRIEPPRAVLSGHLQEVTCVAVSQGKQPKIISGSEDHTVRIWEKVPNSERWEEKARLDHFAILRALACTPPTAKERNLLLTATTTGRGRLFDLDALDDADKQIMLSERHNGAINAVAFNADGTMCATGGEDHAICLWQTSDGKLLSRVKSAHKAGVTSLAFTPKGQLVSAGKDRRLVVWDQVSGGEGGKTLKEAASFDRRSGEVAQLGIDHEGKHVLFDEGRELRVLSLESRKIEGTLANAPGSPSFSTLALYSPDGSTILTNGNAAGRLQLWRAPRAGIRSAELRQFAWSKGNVTSGAFDPSGGFVVTGTTDSRILVWPTPSKAEAEKPLVGQLSYVEEFLDTSLKRVAVKANLENPGWIIPGGTATIVVPPPAK